MSKDFVEQDAEKAFGIMGTFVGNSGTLSIVDTFIPRFANRLSKEKRAKLVQVFDDESYYGDGDDDNNDVVFAIEKFIQYLIFNKQIEITATKKSVKNLTDEFVKKLSGMKHGKEITFSFDRHKQVMGLKNHFSNYIRYLVNLIDNGCEDVTIDELRTTGDLDRYWVKPNKSQWSGYLPSGDKASNDQPTTDDKENDRGSNGVDKKGLAKRIVQAKNYIHPLDYMSLLKSLSSKINFDNDQKRRTPGYLLREIVRIMNKYNVPDLYLPGATIDRWLKSNSYLGSPKYYSVTINKSKRHERDFFSVKSEFSYPDPMETNEGKIDIYEKIFSKLKSSQFKKFCFMPMVPCVYELIALATNTVNIEIDKNERKVKVSYVIYDDSYDTNAGISSSDLYRELATCLSEIDDDIVSENILNEENGSYVAKNHDTYVSKWTEYLYKYWNDLVSADQSIEISDKPADKPSNTPDGASTDIENTASKIVNALIPDKAPTNGKKRKMHFASEK